MNITLSAGEELIKKARNYASERNTTINQIIRDYLARLVGEASNDEVAREYEAVKAPPSSILQLRLILQDVHCLSVQLVREPIDDFQVSLISLVAFDQFNIGPDSLFDKGRAVGGPFCELIDLA
jgi:hypothetical protein